MLKSGYIFRQDMVYKASPMFKCCPMCGSRDFLRLRKVTLSYFGDNTSTFCSVRCEACHLVYGEDEGFPVFNGVGDLLASWNRRKY